MAFRPPVLNWWKIFEDFIEIEAIKGLGSVELTRKKLFEFAKELGIDVSRIELRGYPFLLMEKKGLIKQ